MDSVPVPHSRGQGQVHSPDVRTHALSPSCLLGSMHTVQPHPTSISMNCGVRGNVDVGFPLPFSEGAVKGHTPRPGGGLCRKRIHRSKPAENQTASQLLNALLKSHSSSIDELLLDTMCGSGGMRWARNKSWSRTTWFCSQIHDIQNDQHEARPP